MKTLSLVVPCHNEAHRLDTSAFVAAVERWPWISFCFVDDGSTDQTAEIISHLCRLSPAIHSIYLPKNVGKAAAVRRGVRHLAANTHSDYIGFLDADLATPLDEVPAFLEAFERRPGLVAAIGSRWPHLGADIRRSATRSLASSIVKAVIRRFLGVPVWDTQCGAKVFMRSAAAELFEHEFRTRWLFDVEILKRLGLKRLRSEVLEIPLSVWYDVPGSKVSLAALVDLARLLLRC